MNRIDDEFQWFDTNRETVIVHHENEYAVIRDHTVKGYFPGYPQAIAFMEQSRFKPGDFIVQPCRTKKQETAHYYTGTFAFQ